MQLSPIGKKIIFGLVALVRTRIRVMDVSQHVFV